MAIRTFALAAALMGSAAISTASAQPPAGAPPERPVAPFEYAVKFVCGRSASAAARPQTATGNYYTLINVHNPNSGRGLELNHKVALARVAGEQALMTGFSTNIALRYDEAVDLDCPWIVRQLAAAGLPTGGLLTGFVVIQAKDSLDVVAVYTAASTTTNQVTAIHTERVPVRRVMSN